MGKGPFTERPAGLAPASPTGWWTSFLGPQTRGSGLRAEACIMIILHRSAARNPPTRPCGTHPMERPVCSSANEQSSRLSWNSRRASDRWRTTSARSTWPSSRPSSTPCRHSTEDRVTQVLRVGLRRRLLPAGAGTRRAAGECLDAGCRSGTRVDRPPGASARSCRAADELSRALVGRADQRSPAKRSFSGTAAPVASLTRTKVSMPINSPNLSLPILRKKMFSP